LRKIVCSKRDASLTIRSSMSRILVALALAAPAAAFVHPVAKAPAQLCRMSEEAEAAPAPAATGGRDALYAQATALPGPGTGPWDPLSLADQEWAFGEKTPFSNDATVGFLRHAEIKHGRVAMAAFLGFIAGCTPLVSGEHAVAPYRGYVAGGTPFEQWDNMPLLAKAQIFIAVGMLESYGEGAGNPAGYVPYRVEITPSSRRRVDGVRS